MEEFYFEYHAFKDTVKSKVTQSVPPKTNVLLLTMTVLIQLAFMTKTEFDFPWTIILNII